MHGADPRICIECKGHKRLCGLARCPLISSSIYRSKAISILERGSIDGSTPPSIVVGESSYPRARIYIGVPPKVRGDRASIYDNPSLWYGKLGLEDIIDLRSGMVYLMIPRASTYSNGLHTSEIGFAILSLKPVDTEARISKVTRPYILLDSLSPPLGPSAIAEDIKVLGNPVIHKQLENLVNDDVRASKAIVELYRCGVDFYTIVRAFSLGFLGRYRGRRIVPTRWSITAVDQMLGNHLLSTVRSCPTLSDTQVFYGEYLYNRYIVVLSPDPYKSMWVELWHPSAIYNPGKSIQLFTVEELTPGSYTTMDGGYIAARTSIAEYLHRIGRQAKVVILREILPQYIYPVGNWQIRLTVKHALEKGAVLRNPTERELKEYIGGVMPSIPDRILERLLDFIYSRKQKTLREFTISKSTRQNP